MTSIPRIATRTSPTRRIRTRASRTSRTRLEAGWDIAKGKSKLAWVDAKQAIRSAWHSVERVLPGDADRDGR